MMGRVGDAMALSFLFFSGSLGCKIAGWLGVVVTSRYMIQFSHIDQYVAFTTYSNRCFVFSNFSLCGVVWGDYACAIICPEQIQTSARKARLL